MINWKQKLSSRKFWFAVCGFVSSLLVCFKYSESEITQVTGLIMSGAVCIGFILGESSVDASRAANDDIRLLLEDDKKK